VKSILRYLTRSLRDFIFLNLLALSTFFLLSLQSIL